jgi:large subunit ribosomal protein L28
MGRECEVSGKKTSFGNRISTRGKAKYLGGVGTKCTGISRRMFKPNLQRIHVWLPNGEGWGIVMLAIALKSVRTELITNPQ